MNIDTFTKSQCVQLLGDHNILVSKAEAKRTPVSELRARAKAAAAKTETKVLKQPGALSDVKAVRGDTKRAAMIQALVKGATLDQLAKLTGWPRDTCSGALYTDVVSASYGLEREGRSPPTNCSCISVLRQLYQ